MRSMVEGAITRETLGVRPRLARTCVRAIHPLRGGGA
jgi:hypothetical protein